MGERKGREEKMKEEGKKRKSEERKGEVGRGEKERRGRKGKKPFEEQSGRAGHGRQSD